MATSRRGLLARAAALGAATLGAGAEAALWAPAGARARTRVRTPSEGQVLGRLVEVEQLLLFSYQAALRSGVLSVASRAPVAQIAGYEREHVRALGARLAAMALPVPPPPADARAAAASLAVHHAHVDFERHRDDRGWLGLLLDVELLVQRNYHVALGYLQDPTLLALCAQIYASEGQHSALLGLRLHPGKPKLAIDPFVNGN